MIRKQRIVPGSWRRKSLSIVVMGLGSLVFHTTAHAQRAVLTQVYTCFRSCTAGSYVATRATFDASSLTGIGTEVVPLDSFTMVFSTRGVLQTACIVPSVPPYPESTLLARYKDGVFVTLVSQDNGGNPSIRVKPPANALGENISLGKDILLDFPCCAGTHFYGLTMSEGPCDVPSAASATFRNAGSNPVSYTADAPALGTVWVASVDLTTTGHSLAEVQGYTSPVTATLGGGQVLLVGGPRIFKLPLKTGPLATWAVMIPNDCALAGVTLYTQAIHVGGVAPFALSNSQDLLIGY